ncbi:hypothetical protein EG346_21800 [Chryseobacterium carnipullorum]|uniref:Lipocalin-like domain-containing protein n=1 Tax=Chryseobacterium carnipullorum TaxID=1124835 RepID=A0A3G6MB36_CHRCU|nr:hypothetical protein [Chryseobacterium carnipullorum]AZA50646.1 hypothetical protein EG346_21800 [Chryseobacterium carnipullorum]AZA65512.1 hypothetical protein EG345_12885 [Chryseobacterium carnipullorum]MDN5475642.1 hypothetical protein [Chryseobacterium sp.]HBV14780.1 hypothetical protein [Chryseobacterium carnipullorum]
MRKYILIVCLSLAGIFKAQTSKELIGKWQLVETQINSQPKDIKSIFGSDTVFQDFMQNSSFEATIGKKRNKGKWELTKENNVQILSITVGKNITKFNVDYFDENKRTISFINNGNNISLTYKKI